ncbi:hypothetical protein ACIRU3_26345 [Streptomyces sp. NPDC101151]|uniref:hypothetical protein n=1 Tax=Streptomyces sp. NPDC101151 TaxID=3366115 RepID=UPI00380A1549
MVARVRCGAAAAALVEVRAGCGAWGLIAQFPAPLSRLVRSLPKGRGVLRDKPRRTRTRQRSP